MRQILIFISMVLLLNCSESSYKNTKTYVPESLNFSEQTALTKSIIDSLGNKNEYKGNGFILYCKKGSYSNQNIEHLFNQIDAAILRIKQVLKITTLPRGFYLIMLESRDEMERIIGHRYKGISIRQDDLAIFVYNTEIRPYFKHELFHLVAFHVLGNTPSRLLNEGGAMFADNNCLSYENPIEVINKYLFEKKQWFSFNELVNNFSEKASENDMIAYLESAYIFKYLYENYEFEKLMDLWKYGFAKLKNIYGIDLLQLENMIYLEMQKIKYQEVDWPELIEKGCG